MAESQSQVSLQSEKSVTSQKSQKSQNENKDWKPYHGGMVNKMAIQKLKESTRMRDRELIQRSLDECKTCEVPDNDPDVKKAKRTLKVLGIKDNLQKAIDSQDIKEIDKQVKKIVEGPYRGDLQLEVAEAEQATNQLERSSRHKHTILDMDKRTMSEMRRFANPPEAVKKVMQATLLLLGDDEATTEHWGHCMKLCNPDGPTGLNRRLMTFESSNVHPEIAARAREMLAPYELSKVKSVSSSVATFYVWSMGVLDECKSQSKQDSSQKDSEEEGEVQPANIARQREIFGRPPCDTGGKEQPWKTFGYMRRQKEASKVKTQQSWTS